MDGACAAAIDCVCEKRCLRYGGGEVGGVVLCAPESVDGLCEAARRLASSMDF